MTEDEAKKRWCPFSRVVGYVDKGGTANIPENQAAFNRMMNKIGGPVFFPAASCCIASECMAWRRLAAGDGYCGLASNP